ncbi:MAG TPA: hypothetical protein VF765_20490 [Polyangiaceae bacterium]
MRIVSALVVVPSVVALMAACSSAPEQESTSQGASELGGEAPQHVQPQKDAHGKGGGGGGALVDHGGRVLSASNTYAIWWGTPSGFPSDAQAGIDALFGGFNGTSFLGIADQYMRGASVSTAFHQNLTDSASSPPTHSPSTSTIVNEACNVINANGMTPDPNAIYFVYTSNFPGGHTSYCAWHSDGTCDGVTIQVAYMPNTTGIAGCDPGDLYGCNSYSQGTRSLANVTSHEYMEAITDPDLNAWYDSGGSEIGDKCAWQFSSCVKLGTGSWQLQEEYSNSAGGCVQ